MIEPHVLRAMLVAGATAEMIVAAVEADYAAEAEKKASKRSKDAERQRNRRHAMSRNVTRTDRDSAGQGVTKERPPDPQKKTNPPGSPSGKPSSLETNFLEFWEAYPKRVAKGSARKAYRNARKRASHAEILAGVERYAVKVRGTEAEFIAHPASWLNADRWLDEDSKKSPTVTQGPWKPFKPEKQDPTSPSSEERERQVQQALKKATTALKA